MIDARASAIAPSSKLALYLAAVVSVYLVGDAVATIIVGTVFIALALFCLRAADRPVPAARWKAAIFFLVWVFLMRAALDLVTGVPVTDASVWLAAGRQVARIGVLAIGAIVVIALIRPREIVNELEESRVPRAIRMLVMMLVQYPRVLRDRYEQIVEAQVARGAERPRSIAQRVSHGAAVLLPVMQSELNAIGDRATLIHLRGLDHPSVVIRRAGPMRYQDGLARALAVLLVAAALASRAML